MAGPPGGLGEPEVARALAIDAAAADRRRTRLGSRTAELTVVGPARWWTVDGEVVLVQLEDPRCTPPPVELLLDSGRRTGRAMAAGSASAPRRSSTCTPPMG